jgi:hypothetical protein
MTEANNTFTKANTESKVSGAEAQDSDAECRANDIKSGLRDIQTICHPLKCKAMTGRQGSKVECRNLTRIDMSDHLQIIHW